MVLIRILVSVFILNGFVISSSLAHEGATGVVKQRMHLMKTMGKGMKQMRGMTKGKIAYNQAAYMSHIQDLKMGTEKMLHQFPEGSMQPPTEARPSIWAKWDNFETLTNKLSEEVTHLEQVYSEKDSLLVERQLKRVGKVCLECHKKFRKKKK